MNWARAKTILIILFVIVDLLLVVDIVYYQSLHTSKNNGTISDGIDYLKSKNIIITGKLPEKIISAPILDCSIRLYNREELRESLFANPDKVRINLEPSAVVMLDGPIRVWLTGSNEITYENSGLKSTDKSQTAKDTCQKNINDFLAKLDVDVDSGFTISNEYKDGILVQRFGQKYKDYIINQSYIEISAANTGVTKAKIHWLMSIQPRKDHPKPTTIYDMLLSFGYYFKPSSVAMEVKTITQGYYWDTQTSNISGTVDISVVPVWRYDTEKKSIYQNIYSANIENRAP